MYGLVVSLMFVLLVSNATFGQSAAQPTSQPSTQPADYLSNVRHALLTQWPKNRAVRIVCHGHSVPAGYFKTPRIQTMDAYPHLLHEKLCQAFPHAVTNVIVTAIGGENSVKGAARFENDVLSLKPDVVTIDYALNDRGPGLAKARVAWVSMIQAAQKAGIRVILLTPTGDLSAKLDDPNDPLNQHAEQIRALAKEYDVGLVDSLAIFKQHLQAGEKLDDLMSQVNHPNRRGHELVAAELMKWFAAAP